MSALSSLGSEPCVFTRRRNSPFSRSMTLVVWKAVHRQQLVASLVQDAALQRGAAQIRVARFFRSLLVQLVDIEVTTDDEVPRIPRAHLAL